MAHLPTYRDDDPYLADVRRLALALPDALEKTAWGQADLPDRADGQDVRGLSAAPTTARRCWWSSPEPDERDALLADPRFSSPKYFGPYGWVGLDLVAAPVDLDEVGELLDASYRQVALKRQVAVLDRGSRTS